MSRVLSEAMAAAVKAMGPEPTAENPLITLIRQMESMVQEVEGRARQAEDYANEARLAAMRMREELKVRRELVEDDLGLSRKCEECERRFVPEKAERVCLSCTPDEHAEWIGGAV